MAKEYEIFKLGPTCWCIRDEQGNRKGKFNTLRKAEITKKLLELQAEEGPTLDDMIKAMDNHDRT